MAQKIRALLQKDGRCLICEHRCLIKDGEKGHCKTKTNEDGIIYTLNYGNISSISINPIEKKPLFHFYPGSQALTVGYWSCNFNCPWCQNYELSKVMPKFTDYLHPEDFINHALTHACEGISLSFNEPTIFLEWGIEVCQIAKKKNLYTTIVSNGYMTEKALRLLIDAGLDAANIDIKGDKKAVSKYCGADIDKIWRNCKIIKAQNIHLEITTLIIPTVNDDQSLLSDIGKRISNELGDATPWHLTRYFPAYKWTKPPTPTTLLEDAYNRVKGKGLKFVYLGNISEHNYENTYCPQCGTLLIKRTSLGKVQMKIDKRLQCPECRFDLKKYFIV